MDYKNDYKNLNDISKIKYIDNKMEEILKPFGFKIQKVSQRPREIEKFLFFKQPNIFILKEDKISDKYNYVYSLKFFIYAIYKEFDFQTKIREKEIDKLVFIYLMEFPIHYLIVFLIQLSYKIPIEIYFPQSQIDKYKLKELETNTDLFKIELNEELKELNDEDFDLFNFNKTEEKDKEEIIKKLSNIKIYNLDDAVVNNYLVKN